MNILEKNTKIICIGKTGSRGSVIGDIVKEAPAKPGKGLQDLTDLQNILFILLLIIGVCHIDLLGSYIRIRLYSLYHDKCSNKFENSPFSVEMKCCNHYNKKGLKNMKIIEKHLKNKLKIIK